MITKAQAHQLASHVHSRNPFLVGGIVEDPAT
jgi:predicted PhzF superfamily epimerase YddE/YHI9